MDSGAQQPASHHATASLRHLAQRRPLDPLHRQLPAPERLPRHLLRQFAAGTLAIAASERGDSNASWLQGQELIAPGARAY